MARINFGNSVMDELCKIGLEKGWIKSGEDKDKLPQSKIEDIINPYKLKAILPEEYTSNINDLFDFYKFVENNNVLPEYLKKNEVKDIAEEFIIPLYIKWYNLIKEKESSNLQRLPPPSKQEPKILQHKPKSKYISAFQREAVRVLDDKSIIIDGHWGPITAKAWNSIIEKYLGPMFTKINPNGKEIPDIRDLVVVINKLKTVENPPFLGDLEGPTGYEDKRQVNNLDVAISPKMPGRGVAMQPISSLNSQNFKKYSYNEIIKRLNVLEKYIQNIKKTIG